MRELKVYSVSNIKNKPWYIVKLQEKGKTSGVGITAFQTSNKEKAEQFQHEMSQSLRLLFNIG